MSNVNDREYIEFLQRMNDRYRHTTKGVPVFKVNVDKAKLWNEYLGTFDSPQYHNCDSCKSFFNHYAGLVVIADNGDITSALFDPADARNPEEKSALRTLKKMVESSKVGGVFYSSEPMLGYDLRGGWRHMHVFNPTVFVDKPKLTAGQAISERAQEYAALTQSCRELSGVARDGLRLLKSGTLYRGAEFVDYAKWFADTSEALGGERPNANRSWLTVAKAPHRYAYVRGSMLGTLLRDLASGSYTAQEIKDRWGTAMENYQRAQAAPSATQVALAEQAVEAMEIAPAFARRYTTELDIPGAAYYWTPQVNKPIAPTKKSAKSGIFDSVRPKPATVENMVDIPPKAITLEKFMRDVLPHAARIDYRVPMVGRFCSLTTAQNPDAPPILAWDRSDDRNPVAWAFPNPPAMASEWSLTPGALVPVKGIVQSPNLWSGDSFTAFGNGVFLMLEGAMDKRGMPGGGLFVEHLRADLKPYRRTIEAFLKKQTVDGADHPMTFAFGVGLLAGNDWTERAAPAPIRPKAQGTAAAAPDRVHVILVMDDSGSMKSYIEAARQAARSLLNAAGKMPGKVDITVYKFGTQVHQLVERVPLDSAANVEYQLTGGSGQTALNDAILRAINDTQEWHEIGVAESFFLGIVTDGEENQSRATIPMVAGAVDHALSTGVWTIAYAGAGRNPQRYAQSIGIPEGNVAVFEASAEGFRDVGARYAASTADLASSYRSGARSSNTFFSAASGRQSVGTDYPIVQVTTHNGDTAVYKIDRWD